MRSYESVFKCFSVCKVYVFFRNLLWIVFFVDANKEKHTFDLWIIGACSNLQFTIHIRIISTHSETAISKRRRRRKKQIENYFDELYSIQYYSKYNAKVFKLMTDYDTNIQIIWRCFHISVVNEDTASSFQNYLCSNNGFFSLGSAVVSH